MRPFYGHFLGCLKNGERLEYLELFSLQETSHRGILSIYKNTWWAKADSSQQCPVSGHEANQNTWDSIWPQDGTRKHIFLLWGGVKHWNELCWKVVEISKPTQLDTVLDKLLWLTQLEQREIGLIDLKRCLPVQTILWLFWHRQTEQICSLSGHWKFCYTKLFEQSWLLWSEETFSRGCLNWCVGTLWSSG